MNKLLQALGAFSGIVILAIIGFVSHAAWQGSRLDETSKAYTEETIRAISATWSQEELTRRASPELIGAMQKQPELLVRLFDKLKTLGKLKAITATKGGSKIMVDATRGKLVLAEYLASVQYEGGDAQISVRLINRAGEWKLLYYYVNSPALLKQA